jgi:HSP20 family molecular chaperone IbpA
MWSEALQMLARAERLHREVFNVPRSAGSAPVSWEPPADVLETEDAVLVLVALPGVDPKRVQLVIRNGILLIAGERVLPRELHTAVIHRLELPQGRFERQIRLPAGTYEAPASAVADGCLIVRLPKIGRKGTP